MRKILAFALAFIMLAGVLLVGVSAEETVHGGAECACGK